MNYYIDIKLLTDSEITLGFIWKKLYAQIHLALVEVRDDDSLVSIGLSFPKYTEDRFLGDTLRLFAPTQDELEALDLNQWLGRLLDYLTISEIKEVPSNTTEFVSFRRKQFKVNIERLARRQAKRKGISFEEALKNYENFDEEEKKRGNRLPYINVKSLSSEQEMKLFIEKSKVKEEKIGLFSTYGLSRESTVPWF
jgi:CRISPR-associated endonuclease Csy4